MPRSLLDRDEGIKPSRAIPLCWR